MLGRLEVVLVYYLERVTHTILETFFKVERIDCGCWLTLSVHCLRSLANAIYECD